MGIIRNNFDLKSSLGLLLVSQTFLIFSRIGRLQVKRITTKALTLAVALVAGLQFGLQPAQADTYHASAYKKQTTIKTGTYWQRHPKVKSAAVGAGVGTAVGAVTGLVTKKGVVKGAAIGAGTGTGVGLLQSSETMKRHPIVKDVAQGTLVGAGLGLAGTSGHGKYKKSAKIAAAGAAVGLGVGLFKNLR